MRPWQLAKYNISVCPTSAITRAQIAQPRHTMEKFDTAQEDALGRLGGFAWAACQPLSGGSGGTTRFASVKVKTSRPSRPSKVTQAHPLDERRLGIEVGTTAEDVPGCSILRFVLTMTDIPVPYGVEVFDSLVVVCYVTPNQRWWTLLHANDSVGLLPSSARRCLSCMCKPW